MRIAEEMLLKKFNGDVAKAAAFSEAFIISLEYANNEVIKLFDPDGQVMKSMMKEFGDYVDYLKLPRWKKVLVVYS